MGGVERYTYNLARELIKMGHRVTVVTSNTEQTPGYSRSEEGIEVYDRFLEHCRAFRF